MTNASQFDDLAERAIANLENARTPSELAAAEKVISDIRDLAEQMRTQKLADTIAAEHAHVRARLDGGDDIDRAAFNLDGFGYGKSDAFDELQERAREQNAADAERSEWMFKRQAPSLWAALTGEKVRQADDPRANS